MTVMEELGYAALNDILLILKENREMLQEIKEKLDELETSSPSEK